MSTHITIPRLAAALALAAAVAIVPASPAAAAGKVPAGLKFYVPPKSLKGKHGDLIRVRKLTGKLAFTGASKSYLLLYRSTSIAGKPIAVSGTLALPKGKAPKGGWPVVSWSHGTSGAADICAPSHNPNAYAVPQFQDWLASGYAVAATDFEGLGTPGPHPYLIGKSEGRGAIDIVTAAAQVDKRVGRRWVSSGISQGGHAALWAAAEGPKWAPKLKLEGADIYAPGSHIHEEIELTRNFKTASPLSVIGALLTGGALAAYPQTIKADEMLTPAALALLPDIEKRCNADLAKTDSWGGIGPGSIIRDDYDRTALYKVLDANDPRVLKLTVPTLMHQGTTDVVVFPFFTDEVVEKLKANGADVDYRKYPGADHNSVVAAGRADSKAWIAQILK